jgi:N12 class adenine-specific DNA methylase
LATKFQRIAELLNETVLRLTGERREWQSFLKTAARLYKYPFHEKVLIYAQRPDASACAPIEVWNKTVQRWVNPGAKGIALISDTGRASLKHVFDVSDTHSLRNIPFRLWKIKDAYNNQVVEELENQFGEIGAAVLGFENALTAVIANAVEDNYPDYYNHLMGVRVDSLLEELDELNVERLFREALNVSIAYTVFSRLGLDAGLYFHEEAFRCVPNFNTFDTVMQLGSAVSDISEMVLRQIERTVKSIEQQERDRLAKSNSITENIGKDEKERKDEYGDNIHETGRVLDTRSDTGRAGDTADRQIRDDAQDVSQKPPEGDILGAAPVRETGQPSGGYRLDGTGASGSVDGEAAGVEPATGQSGRSDGMDGTHEQPQAPGGGSGTSRSDLQLNGRQWHDRKTEDKSLPFFHSTRQINAILRTTPYLKASKQQIIDYLSEHDDYIERPEYIIGIFNDGRTELQIKNETYGYEAYQNVLHLWQGRYEERTAESFYSWATIAAHFDGMILMGEFLDESPLPDNKQQIALIEQAEEEKTSAFTFPQEAVDAILRQGSGVQDGKYRICLQMQKNATPKENTDFLKNEYGTGGRYPAITGTDIDEQHDSKGITLTREESKLTLSWMKVQKRIGELIASDRYLHSKEKERLPEYIRETEERRQQAAEVAYAREVLSHEPAGSVGGEKQYALAFGCKVYLGYEEYEVVSFDGDTVELRDTRFPLLIKELARADFDRMLRENPLNDLLVVSGESMILHVGDPGAPEWLKETGDITLTREGDTVTIDSDGEGEKTYVEFDNELPEPAGEEIVLGTELFIDGRQFVIDSISKESDSASLRDITFEQGTGFPIFRRESIAFIRRALEQQIEPVSRKTPQGETAKVRIESIPEQPKRARIDFRITDDALGVGGQKTKYAWNVTAIRQLKWLEAEDRVADPDEQAILSRYVGWGGLPQAFDEQNSQWAKEFAELKKLLTEDEYNCARASTLNAHYTAPIVIKAIYTCLESMGFKTGNILEPACGIGNFFGLVPDSMKSSKLYGVELDSITGRIAKQLYQNASITVQGYESMNLPDSFFDLAIGNVPFGSFGVADKKYDKHRFLIHDYFFAKSLDKVRPRGIIAFITSKGTMDKQNPEVRKYIAQRADLLGAVRLPNNAFYLNAGTEVTTDIIFLQKRDRLTDVEPDWVHLGVTDSGIPINSYFIENPDMVLGTMALDERMYGNTKETACLPFENADLGGLLKEALENIHAEIGEPELEETGDAEVAAIPADPGVRNFSFALVEGQIYYRENSQMHPVETSVTAQGRIRGMIELRDCVRELIEYQTEDYGDEEIRAQQRKLNRLYDTFTAKYGLINSRGNNMAFSDDSAYCLLCSLEVIDENGEMERKADMFTRRTIRQRTAVSHVDTAAEALAISIAEKARVDMKFMQSLTGLVAEQIEEDLQGVVFRDFGNIDPENVPRAFFDITAFPLVTADEYLSGNVRSKLQIVRGLANALSPEQAERLAGHITALEAVQPADLSASEIDVRLGATWLPPDVIKEFVFELLETPYLYKRYIDVLYSEYTANWSIKGKNEDSYNNIKANVTYGTKRVNAYKIIEDTLNLKDVRIFDTAYDADGRETRALNKQETAIAQQKQEAIKEAFRDWIWKDQKRREQLTQIYNERFNSIRPREYDGSHIRFTGMNPEITLRKHQVDAVAHILYGGNTLLAHCVGAGKTYEMVAASMESKHLGLCSKSLFVVPNHLTEQWSGEFLQLYPSANILVATKKDFETKNRKKFCARIATGDFDAVIIGHSQFEKIPVSQERQKRQIETQICEITSGIQELKSAKGERYAIKQLEKTKKGLELRLKKLLETGRKDDVVTFEELGADRLFVDEADNFKNLFLYTKMRNVAGISQTEAQKSSDLYLKCQYLDELTEGRGIVFATGTPISNSITEMYTMQRYLQYETLKRHGLQHFDCWASTFGETVTAIELAPEGTGYRAKTRFARFYNLPELMSMFKEIADIKTADMLNLPVPKANFRNIAVKPSGFQRGMVAELAERAEKVRNRMVEPHEDNMLRITNDGRKLALDQRLMNALLPDDEASKVNACADSVFQFWQEHKDQRLTQLVFCDLSTPKNDGTFNVYDDIRKKLLERGVPESEVVFIHDANTEERKKELYAKVRRGQVRILLGSTFKMGAGTNVQDRLIALHDLDCPWRPRDLEQRAGRIVRQGNKNPEVHIHRYVTENTFDAYLYQILENKQRFISQIMTSKSPVRSAEDIDEAALSYAEVKALATGNPFIKEKMDLDIQVSRLRLLKANHLSQRYALEDRLIKQLPQQIKAEEERIAKYAIDIDTYTRKAESITGSREESKFAGMSIKGIAYNEKAHAGLAILEACKAMTSPQPQELGSYMGFAMLFSFDCFYKDYRITLRGALSHTVVLGTDAHGNITRLNHTLAELPKKLEYCLEQLKTFSQQMETAKEQIALPFEKEQELNEKTTRLNELNILLNMDKHENEIMDTGPDEETLEPERNATGYER